MISRCTFVLLAVMIAVSSFGQRSSQFFVTIGGNIRLPHQDGLTYGVYPIVGFKKDLKNKFLFGGLNAGLSHLKPIGEHFDLKTTVNISRQVYWDEPVRYNKGPNPQDALGVDQPRTAEYYFSPSGVIHYTRRTHFSVGAGLGLQLLLVSKKRFPERAAAVAGTVSNDPVKNREYKPVMPVIPVEFSWRGDKMLYNIRCEAGLLNRFRGDLKAYGPNFFGLVAFEIGMKI
jgi:hypothetical protein